MFLAMIAFSAAFITLLLVFFAVFRWARLWQLAIIVAGIIVTGGLATWAASADALR